MDELLTLKPINYQDILKKLENIEKLLSGNKHNEDDIMTVEETSDYLKVSQPTIYRYIRHLGLPSQKIGNQRRFRKCEIDDWVNMQRF